MLFYKALRQCHEVGLALIDNYLIHISAKHQIHLGLCYILYNMLNVKREWLLSATNTLKAENASKKRLSKLYKKIKYTKRMKEIQKRISGTHNRSSLSLSWSGTLQSYEHGLTQDYS